MPSVARPSPLDSPSSHSTAGLPLLAQKERTSCATGDSAGGYSSHQNHKMIVVHSDASVRNGYVAIGFKLYQPPTSAATGEPVRRRSHTLFEPDELEGEYSSVMAEYRAVLEAARAAKAFDDEFLLLKSDSESVVEKVRRGIPVTPDARLRDELHAILENVDEWRVTHVNRDLNEDAHQEARKAIRYAPTVA